jgi:hypothetical protein
MFSTSQKKSASSLAPCMHISLARSLRALEEKHSTENCKPLLIYRICRFSVACQIHANFTVFMRVCTVRNVYMKGRWMYTFYILVHMYKRIMVQCNHTKQYVLCLDICTYVNYTVVLHLNAQCTFSVNNQDYGYSAILEILYFFFILCYRNLYKCLCQVC